MKAAITTRYGSPEVIQIQDVPKPTIKDNEILIKVMAASMNSGDVRIRGLNGGGVPPFVMRLIFGWKRPKSGIQGLMFAGVIEEVGSKVEGHKVGDEVYGSTGMRMGAHAEYVTVKSGGVLVKKPHNASFEEAAAIVFGGMSAIYFLEKAGISTLKNAEVMIYGATGSVGVAAVEVAKHYDARITAVCSERGRTLVESLGVDQVVIYTDQDYSQLETRYDLVFDAVGKTKKKDAKKVLKPTGKYSTVGGMDVAKETNGQVDFLRKLFEAGELKANIDKTYPLEQIEDAHRYVDSERKKGNVVIRIGED